MQNQNSYEDYKKLEDFDECNLDFDESGYSCVHKVRCVHCNEPINVQGHGEVVIEMTNNTESIFFKEHLQKIVDVIGMLLIENDGPNAYIGLDSC